MRGATLLALSVCSSDSRSRWRLARPVSPSNSASLVISASARRVSVRSLPLPTKPRNAPAESAIGRPEIDHQRSSLARLAGRTE